MLLKIAVKSSEFRPPMLTLHILVREHHNEYLLEDYININHLSDDTAYSMIDDWILTCSCVIQLQSSIVYFDDKTKNVSTCKNSPWIVHLRIKQKDVIIKSML